MKRLFAIATAALFAAGDVDAQNRSTEPQARSYILSAFVTGAAHAILSADVALSPQLGERLALPGQADRDRIYEALFALTANRRIRVRASTREEATSLGSRTGGNPVFAVEGGAADLLLVYDLQRDQVSFIGLLGMARTERQPAPPAPAPAPAPAPSPEPVARMAPAPPPSFPAGFSRSAFILKPIRFEHGDATLSEQAKAVLDDEGLPKIAPVPAVRYVVRGHSDRLESPDYNWQLSERRAAGVRDYLIAQGVPAENIELKPLGHSVSLTSCAQQDRGILIACLAPDRRVTVQILPPPR
jgi:outer membrane protein OmpA-like peptidoglycan-associated protein